VATWPSCTGQNVTWRYEVGASVLLVARPSRPL